MNENKHLNNLHCKQCGAELAEDSVFCEQCGKRVKPNKWLFVFITIALLLGVGGLWYLISLDSRRDLSGGSTNKHSKAFNESQKVLDNVMESVNKAKDCDELDMATFGILGLLAVEGIDAMPEADQAELDELTSKIDKVLKQKKAELNCQEDSFFDDED